MFWHLSSLVVALFQGEITKSQEARLGHAVATTSMQFKMTQAWDDLAICLVLQVALRLLEESVRKMPMVSRCLVMLQNKGLWSRLSFSFVKLFPNINFIQSRQLLVCTGCEHEPFARVIAVLCRCHTSATLVAAYGEGISLNIRRTRLWTKRTRPLRNSTWINDIQ